jgi:hypothetical protein
MGRVGRANSLSSEQIARAKDAVLQGCTIKALAVRFGCTTATLVRSGVRAQHPRRSKKKKPSCGLFPPRRWNYLNG